MVEEEPKTSAHEVEDTKKEIQIIQHINEDHASTKEVIENEEITKEEENEEKTIESKEKSIEEDNEKTKEEADEDEKTATPKLETTTMETIIDYDEPDEKTTEAAKVNSKITIVKDGVTSTIDLMDPTNMSRLKDGNVVMNFHFGDTKPAVPITRIVKLGVEHAKSKPRPVKKLKKFKMKKNRKKSKKPAPKRANKKKGKAIG
uniref:Uncharacterized protein n=1 Tax=Rhabditophanes sp. KR3021 TaxID=114890 RepID=A0AC35TVU0_9BILA